MATAADIMTRDVVTIRPDTPVGEVAELLASRQFGSVPVVAEDGTVQGLVAEEDLISRAGRLRLPRHIDFLGGIIYLENPLTFEAEAEKVLAVSAREIMTTPVPAVLPDTPIEEVAERLLHENQRRLLVLDDCRRLLGIITRADIVRMLARGGRLPENPEEP